MMWIGADVSKGFIDVLAINASGTPKPLRRFDDTPSGHQAWWEWLEHCRHACTHLHVGVESTGGLERNWVRSFVRWRGSLPTTQLRYSVVDPRAVHRLAKSLPVRCKTDPSSAQAIATYLKMMENDLKEQPLHPPERGFFRSIITMQHMAAKMINQIKSFLPEVQPNLVAATSASGLPAWVLAVLKKYPTAARLARARTTSLVTIPHVTEARAIHLIEQARLSSNALDDDMAEEHMRALVINYERQQHLVDQQWARLTARLQQHDDFKRLCTIPGIGVKTATAWLAELPNITHFRSAKALVGYIGLDPVFEQSGDEIVQKGISHRGSPALRQMLYMAARSAITCHPAIKKFYARLTANGKGFKQALTACMAKLVRIAYACLISQKDFDPEISQKAAETNDTSDRRNQQQQLGRAQAICAGQEAESPISPRERRRRKQKQQQDAQRDQSHKETSSPAVAAQTIQPNGHLATHKRGLKCSG